MMPWYHGALWCAGNCIGVDQTSCRAPLLAVDVVVHDQEIERLDQTLAEEGDAALGIPTRVVGFSRPLAEKLINAKFAAMPD